MSDSSLRIELTTKSIRSRSLVPGGSTDGRARRARSPRPVGVSQLEATKDGGERDAEPSRDRGAREPFFDVQLLRALPLRFRLGPLPTSSDRLRPRDFTAPSPPAVARRVVLAPTLSEERQSRAVAGGDGPVVERVEGLPGAAEVDTASPDVRVLRMRGGIPRTTRLSGKGPRGACR